MRNDYEFSITKVNYIISKLPQEDRDKLPEKVIKFFDVNSNNELLPNNFLKDNNLESVCDSVDKNFLKIIDYYINK